jgi:hypothetical protein
MPLLIVAILVYVVLGLIVALVGALIIAAIQLLILIAPVVALIYLLGYLMNKGSLRDMVRRHPIITALLITVTLWAMVFMAQSTASR